MTARRSVVTGRRWALPKKTANSGCSSRTRLDQTKLLTNVYRYPASIDNCEAQSGFGLLVRLVLTAFVEVFAKLAEEGNCGSIEAVLLRFAPERALAVHVPRLLVNGQ